MEKIKAKIDGGMLIVAFPLKSLLPSKSGKSRIVAQTLGFQETTASIDGHQVKISPFSAMIPLETAAK